MTFSVNPSQPMVSEIFLYARRVLKQPNPQDISDNTLADYLNRFIQYDVPARVQLFDFKTQYSLELTQNIDQYNAPVTYLPGGAVIPTYQTFIKPAYVDGYEIIMQQFHQEWMRLFPNRVYNQFQQNGNGSAGPYNFNLYQPPVAQGHRDQNIQPPVVPMINPPGPNLPNIQNGLLTSNVYITALGSDNLLQVAQDDPINYATGNLIQYDPATPGNDPLVVGSINYLTGAVSVTFRNAIPTTSQINSQSMPYAPGRPQAVLFFDNTFTFRPIPDRTYLFQADAYYNPAAFLATTNAVPFRYMTEYFARGLARKVLQDYGDVEQLQLYEPMFKEQEAFVLRKTYRQNSNVRVPTIYNNPGQGYGYGNFTNF